MVTLEANYSKQLGLPGYSSHQYSVTLRLKVGDIKQVEAESARDPGRCSPFSALSPTPRRPGRSK